MAHFVLKNPNLQQNSKRKERSVWKAWVESLQFEGKTLQTLQGKVVFACDPNPLPPGLGCSPYVVIKSCNKQLHAQSRSWRGHFINENFVEEVNFHRQLTQMKNCDEAIPRLYHYWHDKTNFFVAMEYCGRRLLDHVNQHNPRGMSVKTYEKWFPQVSSIFHQLVRVVRWMHSIQRCHMDLSLENITVRFPDGKNPRIKIIDFGVARHYKQCHQFLDDRARVGKRRYYPLEVAEASKEKPFAANKAEIYTLGIILFLMIYGMYPYESVYDECAKLARNGHIEDLLKHHNVHWHGRSTCHELLKKMLAPVNDRITMDELSKHQFADRKKLQGNRKNLIHVDDEKFAIL